MKIFLPTKVKYIIDQIYNHGYEAYIVGGCVRDSIIGTQPHDYDITSSATPEKIMEIFADHKCIETGIEHGTVSILINEEIFEITTYRVEGEYKDHRRPEKVEYTRSLEEDLKRRDFTINSMAYNEKNGLVDIFGGISDINNKIIKTVGNPDERFEEDGLRMIRAIRFSSKLDFKIEKNTINAIYKNAPIIKNISLERISDELSEIILSDNPQNLMFIFDTKLLNYLNISNEIDNSKLSILKEKLRTLNNIDKDLIKRLAALDFIIKDLDINCKSICNSLIFSKKINKTVNILLNYMVSLDICNLDKIQIKKVLKDINMDIFKTYLEICKGILYNNKNNEIIDNIINILKKIEENNECYTIKNLDINGTDIMNLGYKNEKIGLILNYLLDEVIKNPNINKKNILIEKVNFMQ
ncbi:MAG: CCA tRNA nucleotidyltransferase [Terrisporobacter sp.]